MNFLLDHDVPHEIGRVLKRDGHTPVILAAVLAPTASDQEVFDYAIQESLIILTCNRDDFLALASGRTHPGMIIVIRRRTRIAECAAVLPLIKKAGITGLDCNINFA
jgi:predicted nuclease of predicted toxin-antitoxin system